VSVSDTATRLASTSESLPTGFLGLLGAILTATGQSSQADGLQTRVTACGSYILEEAGVGGTFGGGEGARGSSPPDAIGLPERNTTSVVPLAPLGDWSRAKRL
jgi:hypothetical protein